LWKTPVQRWKSINGRVPASQSSPPHHSRWTDHPCILANKFRPSPRLKRSKFEQKRVLTQQI
jgi:hypothetical protein